MAKKTTETQTVTQADAGQMPSTVTQTTANLPAIIPPSLLALAAKEKNEVADAFSGGVATQPMAEPKSLPLIKINHELGRFDYNGELLDEIRGYPIHFIQVRAWWEKGYKPGSHEPPDCFSGDMKAPSPSANLPQCKSCEACKFSKFGSAPVGEGQACKTTTVIFLINPEFGSDMPIVALLTPPSSIRHILGGQRSAGYFQRAKNFKDGTTGRKAGYYQLVWTNFRLVKPHQQAIHFEVLPAPLGVCQSADEARRLAEIRGRFVDAMEGLRGQTAEFSTGEEDSGTA